jgi:RNA polymerase sigma-32 factor
MKEDNKLEIIEVEEGDEIIAPLEEDIAGEDFVAPEIVSDDLLPLKTSKKDLKLEEQDSKSARALVEYDPLERYLAEIRHVPTLSREEEHELAVKYFEYKDKHAGYKLVLANLKLVVMAAREYQRNIQNILDLVQEGNIGLLEAVKQYDPYRGIRFPSYAIYWIRAYMLRYLINNLRLVKIGTTQAQRKLFFNLQKEKEKLEAEGFSPEAALLAKRLNVRESDVLEMEQRLALPELSVDAPLRSNDSEEASDMHGILSDGSQDTESKVVESQFSDAIKKSVEQFKKSCDEKERAIIEKRLFTEEPETLQVIADEFGLSRERIRQIESRLKEELKRFLQEQLDLDLTGEVRIEGES